MIRCAQNVCNADGYAKVQNSNSSVWLIRYSIVCSACGFYASRPHDLDAITNQHRVLRILGDTLIYSTMLSDCFIACIQLLFGDSNPCLGRAREIRIRSKLMLGASQLQHESFRWLNNISFLCQLDSWSIYAYKEAIVVSTGRYFSPLQSSDPRHTSYSISNALQPSWTPQHRQ